MQPRAGPLSRTLACEQSAFSACGGHPSCLPQSMQDIVHGLWRAPGACARVRRKVPTGCMRAEPRAVAAQAARRWAGRKFSRQASVRSAHGRLAMLIALTDVLHKQARECAGIQLLAAAHWVLVPRPGPDPGSGPGECAWRRAGERQVCAALDASPASQQALQWALAHMLAPADPSACLHLVSVAGPVSLPARAPLRTQLARAQCMSVSLRCMRRLAGVPSRSSSPRSATHDGELFRNSTALFETAIFRKDGAAAALPARASCPHQRRAGGAIHARPCACSSSAPHGRPLRQAVQAPAVCRPGCLTWRGSRTGSWRQCWRTGSGPRAIRATARRGPLPLPQWTSSLTRRLPRRPRSYPDAALLGPVNRMMPVRMRAAA